MANKISNSKLPALFIGRFQPFHFGHLDALAQVFARENYVIIGIGSTEDDYTPTNPFTAGERYQMVEAAVLGRELGGKIIARENYEILTARNIHHYSLWVKHLESLLPPFGAVYTGSSIVSRLFKEEGKHKIHPVRMHKKISATKIRSLMVGGGAWEQLVPAEVVKLIKKWDGVGRLKEIQG